MISIPVCLFAFDEFSIQPLLSFAAHLQQLIVFYLHLSIG